MNDLQFPKIAAYHADLVVEKDNELYQIRIDRPDWDYEYEILKQVAAELGVKTVGEIVEKMKLQLVTKPSPEQKKKIWKWDHQIIK